MTRFPRFRALAATSVVVATLVAGASVGVANATTRPTLKVAPATKLKTGEAVKVSGRGFTPHDQVYIVECLVTATSESGCDIATTVGPITINAKGVLAKTTFHVVTGTVGTGTCGTTTANLRGCAISVGNATGGDAMIAPITFKAPKKPKA
jgi:hypothetical protein